MSMTAKPGTVPDATHRCARIGNETGTSGCLGESGRSEKPIRHAVFGDDGLVDRVVGLVGAARASGDVEGVAIP
jgi:hypothetical protein